MSTAFASQPPTATAGYPPASSPEQMSQTEGDRGGTRPGTTQGHRRLPSSRLSRTSLLDPPLPPSNPARPANTSGSCLLSRPDRDHRPARSPMLQVSVPSGLGGDGLSPRLSGGPSVVFAPSSPTRHAVGKEHSYTTRQGRSVSRNVSSSSRAGRSVSRNASIGSMASSPMPTVHKLHQQHAALVAMERIKGIDCSPRTKSILRALNAQLEIESSMLSVGSSRDKSFNGTSNGYMKNQLPGRSRSSRQREDPLSSPRSTTTRSAHLRAWAVPSDVNDDTPYESPRLGRSLKKDYHTIREPRLLFTNAIHRDESSDEDGGSGLGEEVEEMAKGPEEEVPLDVPEDLRELYRELQGFGMKGSNFKEVSGLDEATIRKMLNKTSQRLEHLPLAACCSSSGDYIVLPLPGPRGVPGWKVNHKGQVQRTSRPGGRYLSMNEAQYDEMEENEKLKQRLKFIDEEDLAPTPSMVNVRGQEEQENIEAMIVAMEELEQEAQQVASSRKLLACGGTKNKSMKNPHVPPIRLKSSILLPKEKSLTNTSHSAMDTFRSVKMPATVSPMGSPTVAGRAIAAVQIVSELSLPPTPGVADGAARPVSAVGSLSRVRVATGGAGSPHATETPRGPMKSPGAIPELSTAMSSSRLGTRESKNKTAVFKAVSQSRQAKEEKKKVPFSSLPKPKDSILGTGNAETRRQYLAAMVEDLTLQAKNASSDDDGSSSNNDFGRRARKQREPEYPDFEPSDGEMDEGFSFLTEPTTVERIEAALKRLRAAKIRGQAAAAFLSAGNDVLDFKVPDTDEDGDEGEDDDEPMQPMQPFNNKANRNLLRTNSSYLAVVEREKVMQAEREERAEKAKRNNAILASGGVVYDDDGSVLVQEDDLERAFFFFDRAVMQSLRMGLRRGGTSIKTSELDSFRSAATNVAKTLLSAQHSKVSRASSSKRQTEDADGDASQAQAEAEALAEAQYLDKWTNTLMVFQAAVDDRMQVHSILDPEDGREPIPDEFIHLQPIAGEKLTASKMQVERRIKQCEDTGNNQLDLSLGITISCGDLGIVYKCLKGRESIHRIKASNNVLTPSGSLAMLDLIKAYPFKELNIVNNRHFGTEVAEKLGEMLPPFFNLPLQHLDIGHCPIKDSGFQALMSSLQYNTQLRYLNVEHCGLTDLSLLHMDHALEDNTTITYLNLSSNRFPRQEGVKELCNDLLSNKSLTHLDLSDCHMDASCGQHLGDLVGGSPGLRLLNLAGNYIDWAGGRAIGDGLRGCKEGEAPPEDPPSAPQASKEGGGGGDGDSAADAGSGNTDPEVPLEELILDRNPLGQAGVIAILRACHEAKRKLPKVSLLNCPLTSQVGQPVVFDLAHPNGTYTLKLDNPHDRNIAGQLVEVWSKSQGRSWLDAEFEGRPLHMVESLNWPQKLPDFGTLKITVISANSVDPLNAPPVANPQLEECMTWHLASSSVSDLFKMQLVGLSTNVACVTAKQVARYLAHFKYRTEKVDAAQLLISSLVDLHNFLPWVGESQCCSEDDMLQLYNQHMDYKKYTLTQESLRADWREFLSGHFKLNLGVQSQRLIAMSLLELAASQQPRPSEWANHMLAVDAQGVHQREARKPVSDPVDGEVLLGSVHCPLRHVQHEGRLLEASTSIPDAPPRNPFNPPAPPPAPLQEEAATQLPAGGTAGASLEAAGASETTLPTCRAPQDLLPGVIRISSSMLPLHGSFECELLPQYRQALKKLPFRHMEPPGIPPKGKVAHMVYNITHAANDAWEVLYRTCLDKLNLSYVDDRLENWIEAPQMWGPGHFASNVAVGLIENAKQRQATYKPIRPPTAPPPPVVEEADAKDAKGKGKDVKGKDTKDTKGKDAKGKGGKRAAAASAKAQKEAERVAGQKAASHQRMMLALVSQTQACLQLLAKHTHHHPVSCFQAYHLLRLFPDMCSRLSALAVMLPSIWDSANLLFIVRSLDCPVVSSPSQDVLAAQREVEKYREEQNIKARIAAGARRGAGRKKYADDEEESDTNKKPVPKLPVVPVAVAPPNGFVQGPHTSTDLLKSVINKVSWRRLPLHWTACEGLDGLGELSYDLSNPDDLQALVHLSQWADKCRGVDPTSAPLDLAAAPPLQPPGGPGNGAGIGTVPPTPGAHGGGGGGNVPPTPFASTAGPGGGLGVAATPRLIKRDGSGRWSSSVSHTATREGTSVGRREVTIELPGTTRSSGSNRDGPSGPLGGSTPKALVQRLPSLRCQLSYSMSFHAAFGSLKRRSSSVWSKTNPWSDAGTDEDEDVKMKTEEVVEEDVEAEPEEIAFPHIFRSVKTDAGSLELGTRSRDARTIEQILGNSCLSPSNPSVGKVSFELNFTLVQQQNAAAATIQAVWRGFLARRWYGDFIIDRFPHNRWRRAWALYVWRRRIQFTNLSASDLQLHQCSQTLHNNFKARFPEKQPAEEQAALA